MDGIEPPIGDGSANPYVEKLIEAGFVSQEAPKDYLVIDQTVMYHNEEEQVDIVALPMDSYRISVMVDYQNHLCSEVNIPVYSIWRKNLFLNLHPRTFSFFKRS